MVNIKHLEQYFGNCSAVRVKTYDIEQYKNHRLSEEHAARSTINLELAAIRRAYNLGYDLGLVTSKPKVVCYRVGNRNARQGFFEHDLYLKMLVTLPPYAKPVLKFGYLAGWREGEIFGLTWIKNYDHEAQVIRLYDSKNEERRTLPLDGELVEVIEGQQKVRGNCSLIFHYEGRHINRSTFNKHWRLCAEPLEKEIGRRIYFHDLRRTAVRNLTRAGVHKVIAKKITGHLTDSIYDRYDIVDEQDIRASLAKVRGYLAKQNGNGNGENGNGSGSVPPDATPFGAPPNPVSTTGSHSSSHESRLWEQAKIETAGGIHGVEAGSEPGSKGAASPLPLSTAKPSNCDASCQLVDRQLLLDGRRLALYTCAIKVCESVNRLSSVWTKAVTD